MSTSPRPSTLRLAILAGALGFAPVAPALDPATAVAQQRAPLQGVVAEEASGRLIPSATVTLVGTGLETKSGSDGTFAFPEAPPGPVSVRAQAPGYPAVVEAVTVKPGVVLFLQIFLPRTVAVLDEIRVTGMRAHGPSGAGAKTAADLVAASVPWVQGFTSGFTSQRGRPLNPILQLRGPNSLNSGGEPIVVLDGVRISGVIGRAMDVLRQIPAAQVKDIRVLRGPSAAHLYGSAGGVIEIRTKSGWPGG